MKALDFAAAIGKHVYVFQPEAVRKGGLLLGARDIAKGQVVLSFVGKVAVIVYEDTPLEIES